MRELLYRTPDGWVQTQGVVVEDPSVPTAQALAAGVRHGEHQGPTPGDPLGAVVVERAWVLGHASERRTEWVVAGDPRTATSWSPA